MAGIAANTTDDVGREVLLLWAVVLAMADLATVLASLVLVVTQCAVQSRKLTKLIALELVLAFGDRGSLDIRLDVSMGAQRIGTYCLNNVMDELLGFVNLFLGIGHDQAVKIFFLIAGVSSV